MGILSFFKSRSSNPWKSILDFAPGLKLSPYVAEYLAAIDRTEAFGFETPPRLLARRDCIDMQTLRPVFARLLRAQPTGLHDRPNVLRLAGPFTHPCVRPAPASQRRDSDRCAPAVTLRCPAPLRTCRHFRVPAFAVSDSPCLAAARPSHPCLGVRSVRRDLISRRKRHPPSPSRTSSVATSCGHTPCGRCGIDERLIQSFIEAIHTHGYKKAAYSVDGSP